MNNPLLELIENTFKKSTIKDLEDNYLPRVDYVTKWMCYSDYCLDDKNKPNDVISFTMVPYIDDNQELAKFVKSVANKDIKKLRKVSGEFIHFLKDYPLINFSFIINERKKLFGKNHIEITESLKATFSYMKGQYSEWIKNQPEQEEEYKRVIKNIECTLRLLNDGKKTKQIIGMLLVSFIGAYTSSQIINTDTKIFGWFSDRDAINEVCNNYSIDLFNYFLNSFTNGQKLNFVVAPAGSTDSAYYEDLVRIPDYIAGTLADYNAKTGFVSKEKFDTMLTDYMSENTHNNFVYNMFDDNGILNCGRVMFKKASSKTLHNNV